MGRILTKKPTECVSVLWSADDLFQTQAKRVRSGAVPPDAVIERNKGRRFKENMATKAVGKWGQGNEAQHKRHEKV